MRVHRRSGDGLLVHGENSSGDTAMSAVAFLRPIDPVQSTRISVQTSLLHRRQQDRSKNHGNKLHLRPKLVNI